MQYEDFQAEIAEVCRRNDLDDLEVQNEIIRILDSYHNLNHLQLITVIPAVLVRTKRENSLEFSISVVNEWVELTTKKFTIKVN